MPVSVNICNNSNAQQRDQKYRGEVETEPSGMQQQPRALEVFNCPDDYLVINWQNWQVEINSWEMYGILKPPQALLLSTTGFATTCEVKHDTAFSLFHFCWHALL